MSIRAVGMFFDLPFFDDEVSRSRAASVTNALLRVKKTSCNFEPGDKATRLYF
jgi:hypothetical protein